MLHEHGSGAHDMALVLTHGWSGWIVEFVHVIERFALLGRFGGAAADSLMPLRRLGRAPRRWQFHGNAITRRLSRGISPAFILSVIPGNNRRTSIAAANSPLYS